MQEEIIEPIEGQMDLESIADPEPQPEVKFGIVVDCIKLNIREAPDKNSESIGVIECGTELMVDETQSTDEFYNVCLGSGVEGYCMKQFIQIQ